MINVKRMQELATSQKKGIEIFLIEKLGQTTRRRSNNADLEKGKSAKSSQPPFDSSRKDGKYRLTFSFFPR